jgi:sulfoxide reductase heme-binding subunit YedZ
MGSGRQVRTAGPRERLVYGAVWLALAIPLPLLIWTGLTGSMRARDALVKTEGLWGIRILLLALALNPLARLLRRPILLRYKRTIGLFGFAYASAHGVFYLLYGRVWEFPLSVWQRRWYISLGIAALILMMPLAITSTDRMMRAMGPSAWRRLHATFYAVMLIGAVHGLWQNNIDYLQPSLYLAAVVLLLIARIRPVMNALVRATAANRRVAKAHVRAATP